MLNPTEADTNRLEFLQITKISLLFLILFLMISQIIISFLIRPWSAKPGILPTKGLVRVHMIIRFLGLFVVVLTISFVIPLPILIFYLILRYIIGMRLEKAPIIYLRSFHYSEGPTALGHIVGRIASRFGILYALVHKEQKGSDLLAESRITEQTLVATVPDSEWQNYVTTMLKSCSVVIIDQSLTTDSLQWEINNSIEFVDNMRIAILQKKGTNAKKVQDIWTLEYDLDKDSKKKARRALLSWFKKIFLNS